MNFPLICALTLPLFLACLDQVSHAPSACKIIPDNVTMLRFNLKSPILKTVSAEDGLHIINIIQSANAAMGIQLKTELLLQGDIASFNDFLWKYQLYSELGKKRLLQPDQTIVEVDRNKGELRIAIPIAP